MEFTNTTSTTVTSLFFFNKETRNTPAFGEYAVQIFVSDAILLVNNPLNTKRRGGALSYWNNISKNGGSLSYKLYVSNVCLLWRNMYLISYTPQNRYVFSLFDIPGRIGLYYTSISIIVFDRKLKNDDIFQVFVIFIYSLFT